MAFRLIPREARFFDDFVALAEQGLMRKVSDALGGTYQPTPAYRIHVRELAREDVWFELDRLTSENGLSRW